MPKSFSWTLAQLNRYTVKSMSSGNLCKVVKCTNNKAASFAHCAMDLQIRTNALLYSTLSQPETLCITAIKRKFMP